MRKIKCSDDDVRRWDKTWKATAKALGIEHMTYTDFAHYVLNQQAKRMGVR